MNLIATASAGAAVFSAVAAGGAWRAAWKSGKATETLTQIEAARRRQELMPQITFLVAPPTSGSIVIDLVLHLEGPIALQRLDSLSVRIRDYQPGRAESLSESRSALTAEEVRAQVWGPFRFTPGVGPNVGTIPCRADGHGRQVDVPAPLQVGENLRFQMETTRPPWPSPPGVAADARRREEDWRQLVGRHIRLTVVARVVGFQPWEIPMEVAAPWIDLP